MLGDKAFQNKCDKVCNVINTVQRLTVPRIAKNVGCLKITSHEILANRLYMNLVEKCMIC